MKHESFNSSTQIKEKDYLFHCGKWKEIWTVSKWYSENHKIQLEWYGNWTDATKLYYDKIEPSYDI